MTVLTNNKNENVINLKKEKSEISEDFIENNLRKFSCLYYGLNQTYLKLIQTEDEVKQNEDSGRMAYTCEIKVNEIKDKIEGFNEKILHLPVTLKTEGKADVSVIILLDRNDYENCFVEEEGFLDL